MSLAFNNSVGLLRNEMLIFMIITVPLENARQNMLDHDLITCMIGQNITFPFLWEVCSHNLSQ